MRAFNPEKDLKKIQYRNRNKIIFGIVALLLILTIGSTYALYQVRYSKRIIYTKVAPFSNRDIQLAVYVNGEKKDSFPSKEENVMFYGIDCENKTKDYTIATWDDDKWGINLFSKGPNKCNVEFRTGKVFQYTNNVQEYTIPKNGTYQIELWGAKGGDFVGHTGGNGAYTSGEIVLQKDDILYFYVGGAGIVGGNGPVALGGYNGGGASNQSNASYYGSGGGGATDVRLTNGVWDDFNSLKSRIMVAAGGGAAENRNITGERYGEGNGGSGGGLIGYTGESINPGSHKGSGGTQTTGGVLQVYDNGVYLPGQDETRLPYIGIFGTGGSFQTGGGGGYYGGGSSGHGGGGGGSSFISGHQGCDAINGEQSIDINNIVHTGNSEHYSGKVFTNTVMIDGEGYNWTTDKGDLVGVPTHDNSNGNGYARITLIKES